MLRTDSWSALIRSGLRGYCPRCGRGKLFAGFLALAPRCEHCGLDFSFADSADGPAFFVMFISGFIVAGSALVVELIYAPPYWVHAALWGPHAGAAAAAEGIDDCAAAPSQGRREALRRRRAMSTPGTKR